MHEWTEVPDVPFAGGPPLPPLVAGGRRRRRAAPEPPRPLGPTGRWMWDTLEPAAMNDAERAQVLMLAEAQDERVSLRVRALRDDDWARNALRTLDAQLWSALGNWVNRHGAVLAEWPSGTRSWWAAVSSLPHAVLWTEADWRYAVDTAHVHAAAMNGDTKMFHELHMRERVLGMTADARRDLRLRYVPPVDPEAADNPSVTAMADYRRSLGT